LGLRPQQIRICAKGQSKPTPGPIFDTIPKKHPGKEITHSPSDVKQIYPEG
jgi:hypothetical protein